MTISAMLVVYNEEARIETCLRCAMWCDEVFVFDKQSTDRTRELARKYTDKVIQIPYSEYHPNEARLVEYANSEWILELTASDLIHPVLAARIRELTDRADFPFDVVHVPYRRYVLGLEGPRSPWYDEVHPAVYRKRVLRIDDESVHGALTFSSQRHYRMPNSSELCMYHLTHETMDRMMERHMRYWRVQSRLYPSGKPLGDIFWDVLRSVARVALKRKTYLWGWDGIALALTYISYWMLNFAYVWEQRRCSAPAIYRRIRENIVQAWDSAQSLEAARE